jgi:replicative DNA helicase
VNAKEEEKLSGALQENILTLLVHSDDGCKIIRSAVTPRLFESAVFRTIAEHAIDYIDQFHEAPKAHIVDSLEVILTDEKEPRRAASFRRLLVQMEQEKEDVKVEYVVSQLHRFVRQQNLKTAVIRAVEAIEDGRIDAAEVELQKGLNTQVMSFEVGTVVGSDDNTLRFLDHRDDVLLTGIEELDRRGVGLRRKTQFVIMAPAKAGKSWALIHLGKLALLQRQCVVHITLEMSEEMTTQRYLQSFFAISSRDAELMLPTMKKDDRGSMTDVFYDRVMRATMRDPNIKSLLRSKIDREFRRHKPLIIKEFPTSSLTITQLEAYLDGLERFHKIIPDVLIIDYPDLMYLEGTDLRVSIGQVVKGLRGVAVRRNLSMAIASQANRTGAQARQVEATHAAEDYSKIATADTVLTYSQTPAEHKLGLARLFAAAVRGEEGQFVSLITQSYAMGQFALDSAHLGNGSYWEYLEKRGRAQEE